MRFKIIKNPVVLMQRLSNWLEQFPLRRRSSQRRADARPQKATSKSAAPPRLRYSVSAATQHLRHHPPSTVVEKDHPMNTMQKESILASWNRQEAMSTSIEFEHCTSLSRSFCTSSFNRQVNHQSPQRTFQKIRTNPWIRRVDSVMSSSMTSSSSTRPELLYPPIRASSLRVTSLNESVCSSGSSGYASHDCSPESSVHSPQWPAVIACEDKAIDCHSIDVDEAALLSLDNTTDADLFIPVIDDDDDEHIYHELEQYNRQSFSSSESELAIASSSLTCSPSPMYTEPFTGRSAAPTFHAPPPPPSGDLESLLDRAELSFLAELDAQIAELQSASEAVRQLVDEARERRDARLRAKHQCMEQMAQLRRLKWMTNNFELHI